MQHTQFAGLTALAPGEPLATDGYSFQTRNPLITDQLLKVGAVTHKHDGHAAVIRPTGAPSASAVASGGIFPADTALMVGYTVTDAQGGETLISDVISVTTPPLMPAPTSPPSAAADYSGGSLRIDTYYYVKTWVDAGGGETTPSTYAQVARAPGFASGQVRFFNLASGMSAVGASGWKLYKSGSDGRFKFLASGTADTFTDDGNICTDCVTPPPQSNSTQQHNRLDVVVPNTLPVGAQRFRVYVGFGGGFFSPSLMGDYPIASAGTTLSYATYTPFDGRPPDVATTLVGANQIDPDTDILDWSWKRSVSSKTALGSGVVADVRMARDTHRLYTPSGASASAAAGWVEIPGNVRIAASGFASAAALGSAVAAQTIVFYGSGVSVRSVSGSAIVDLSRIGSGSTGGGGGGGGGSGITPLSWTNLNFITGWAVYNSGSPWGPAQWTKDDYGVVRLRGTIKKNTGIDSFYEPMFTLPAGTFPTNSSLQPVLVVDTAGNTAMCQMQIDAGGEVALLSDLLSQTLDRSGFFRVFLEGITFPSV